MVFFKLFYCTRTVLTMDLKEVVRRLNLFASTSLAETWDNVGLLVEPSAPLQVKKVLLTNDLTPPVMEEAVSMGANLIISYHPPIFSGMKCITQKTWKERIVATCLENRIGVFSPHTSYDCVAGGVNDWLISAFDLKNVRPVENAMEFPNNMNHSVSFTLPNSLYDIVKVELSPMANITQAVPSMELDSKIIKLCCTKRKMADVISVISKHSGNIIEVKELSKIPKTGYGMGRIGNLTASITLDEAINRVKSHLQLKSLRVAKSTDTNVLETVAVCAGSGGSLLKNVPASLYVTGEMSHHDVLHAVYNGTHVILCDHSNTERGFLVHLKKKLELQLPGVELYISNVDKDPLEIV